MFKLQLPLVDGAGWSHRNPIPSRIWSCLRRFATKREALAEAKRLGWRAGDCQKRFGRFEYAWILVDGIGYAIADRETPVNHNTLESLG